MQSELIPTAARLPPPRVGLRDPGTWLHWMDLAGSREPHRVQHSRVVWLRVVAARGERLRSMDRERLDALKLAALLHDVGRFLDPDDSSPHAFVGAAFLDELGLVDVAPLVAHHSGARCEAEYRGLVHLDRWRSDPELLAILTYVDRTTGPAGQVMTIDERRRELVARHGSRSPQLRWFDACRTEAQLGATLLNGQHVAGVA